MSPQTITGRRGPKPNPQTKENLIRLGMRMLHEKGYSGTGIKDIVNAASVPKGSFYNHFESKEAFGEAVVDFYFESGHPELREMLENESVVPLTRLKTYFDKRTSDYRDGAFKRGCLMGNMSTEMADHSELIRRRIETHFETWSGLIGHCISQAQASGAIKNPLSAALLAEFVLNSWEGALVRMRSQKSDVPLNEFHQVVFGCLLV